VRQKRRLWKKAKYEREEMAREAVKDATKKIHNSKEY
jgi:hypothetical protein